MAMARACPSQEECSSCRVCLLITANCTEKDHWSRCQQQCLRLAFFLFVLFGSSVLYAQMLHVHKVINFGLHENASIDVEVPLRCF